MASPGNSPSEDSHLALRSELRDQIAVLLGGRAAEMLFIGEPSTGAHDDLSRATEIASNMVRKFGMSSLGPRTYEQSRGGYVNADHSAATTSREHGDQTAGSIDKEVQSLVEEGLQRATTVLEEHRNTLEQLADELLKQQQLSGAHVRQALGLPEPATNTALKAVPPDTI